MIRAAKGLAVVYGLAEPRPGTLAIRRTLNAAGGQPPWYPATPPGEFTGEMQAMTEAVVAQLEVHHEQDYLHARRRQRWVQAHVLAAWRARMDAWLDAEWLAWRDLLATYPAPGEA